MNSGEFLDWMLVIFAVIAIGSCTAVNVRNEWNDPVKCESK